MLAPEDIADEAEDVEAADEDQPLQRIIEIAVPKGERPERVDQYLARSIAHSSRTKIHDAIAAGAVTVNGVLLDKSSHKVRGGDVFRITIPRPPRMRAQAEDIALDIVYEDSALLIINKPPGMVVHPAHGNQTGTLVNALLHHIKEFSAAHPGSDPERPGIVHRLDKDTSGLMVVAKTEEAHRNLARQFFQHTAHRVYNAIVWGNIKQQFGRIETQIARHPKDRKRFTVPAESHEGAVAGKLAITDYYVLEEFLGFSFVELKLKTGRTHQIRVHMQHLGHPVFGDAVYSGRAMNVMRQDVPHFKQWVENLLAGLPRQALHARALRIHHPTSGELMEWSVPLPEDMQNVLLAMSKMALTLTA
jgi:23S rRNA pseudouridine1911/1915/1917 synthase